MVGDRLEALERRRADPLRRRVGGLQGRELALEVAQLVQLLVVDVVADLWFVEDVIEAVVAVELGAQLGGAGGDVGGNLGGGALVRGRGVLGRAHAAGAESSTSFSSPQPRSRSMPPWSVRSKWIGVIAIRPAATALRSVPSASS